MSSRDPDQPLENIIRGRLVNTLQDIRMIHLVMLPSSVKEPAMVSYHVVKPSTVSRSRIHVLDPRLEASPANLH
jgi:hypothetical protein